MTYRILADFVFLTHFLFIVFVVAGAWLAVWWPRVAWLHIPSVLWSALLLYAQWVCPLTPLEDYLRDRAGREGLEEEGFLQTYLIGVIYPEGMTPAMMYVAATLVLVLNLGIYVRVWKRRCGSAAGR